MSFPIQTFMLFLLLAPTISAIDKPSTQASDYTGYIQSVSQQAATPVPVFDNVCADKPTGSVTCGEKVTILERRGPWLKVRTADGREVYLGAPSISGAKNKFVPSKAPVTSEFSQHDCVTGKTRRSAEGTHAPKAIYVPDAEFPPNAPKKKFQGTVVLAVTVGTDGHTRDIAIEKPLGSGFDEKAIEAVKQWEFDPAVKEGQPVESRIKVEIHFRRY